MVLSSTPSLCLPMASRFRQAFTHMKPKANFLGPFPSNWGRLSAPADSSNAVVLFLSSSLSPSSLLSVTIFKAGKAASQNPRRLSSIRHLRPHLPLSSSSSLPSSSYFSSPSPPSSTAAAPYLERSCVIYLLSVQSASVPSSSPCCVRERNFSRSLGTTSLKRSKF